MLSFTDTRMVSVFSGRKHLKYIQFNTLVLDTFVALGYIAFFLTGGKFEVKSVICAFF